MREALCNAWPGICRYFHTSGAIIWRALIKYDETDGEQRAASFAYYAFFALFPLILYGKCSGDHTSFRLSEPITVVPVNTGLHDPFSLSAR